MKGFYSCTGQKRQASENASSHINKRRELTTTDMKKAKVLNRFFASVFTDRLPRSLTFLNH